MTRRAEERRRGEEEERGGASGLRDDLRGSENLLRSFSGAEPTLHFTLTFEVVRFLGELKGLGLPLRVIRDCVAACNCSALVGRLPSGQELTPGMEGCLQELVQVNADVRSRRFQAAHPGADVSGSGARQS